MLTILVIDDEKPTLSMFRLFLTAYGYNVLTAEEGKTGLALFKKERPDIVFMDLKMPGMDGLEVLHKIRETGIAVQVVIITGHGDRDKAMEALDLDASDFINKPLEKEALDSALNRAENRIKEGGEQAFEMVEEPNGEHLLVKMSGRLSASCSGILADMAGRAVNFETITLRTDVSFSVNRDGIRILTECLESLKDRGERVSLEGLSYNYCRFFQMAGIHRLCHLKEDRKF